MSKREKKRGVLRLIGPAVALALVMLIIIDFYYNDTAQASDCTKTSVSKTPLIDGLGLYPSGLNVPPTAHVTKGQNFAVELKNRPKNVLISIGMSNTREEFEKFKLNESTTTDKASNLVVVNGANDGQTANLWASTRSATTFATADSRLAAAGATPADVGVAWVKLTNKAEGTLSQWHTKLATDLRNVFANLRSHYPNLKMIFVSSRIYGGYETLTSRGGGLNPEPFAYETGLVYKELVTEHLNGTLQPSIWIGWGPYLWADGMVPRSDGLIWECGDFEVDGVHPGPIAEQKVAGMLSAFLRNDQIANLWFLQ